MKKPHAGRGSRKARHNRAQFWMAGISVNPKCRVLDSQAPIWQRPNIEMIASIIKLRTNSPESRKRFPSNSAGKNMAPSPRPLLDELEGFRSLGDPTDFGEMWHERRRGQIFAKRRHLDSQARMPQLMRMCSVRWRFPFCVATRATLMSVV